MFCLLSASHGRVLLQSLLQTQKIPYPINQGCLCCCLWALPSVSKLGNYKACQPVRCSPTFAVAISLRAALNKLRSKNAQRCLLPLLKAQPWTSLVAQQMICLPMYQTLVWSLVQEDSTCHGATKPVCHNYWALWPRAQELHLLSPHAALLQPSCLEPALCNKRSHHSKKPHTPTRE